MASNGRKERRRRNKKKKMRKIKRKGVFFLFFFFQQVELVVRSGVNEFLGRLKLDQTSKEAGEKKRKGKKKVVDLFGC